MWDTKDSHIIKHTNVVSRRDFLKLAAMSMLAGCTAQIRPQPTVTPSNTDLPTSTHTPTDAPTIAPTWTPTSTTQPSATRAPTATSPKPSATPPPAPTVTPQTLERPHVLGKVLHAHHAGVWNGNTLDPNALQQMLDAAITGLTNLNDAGEAWAALFKPGERVAIKVNSIAGSAYWTHAPLVLAVAEQLQKVGIPAENIVIFDRSTSELESAGYPINRDNAGVRCYGTDRAYTNGWNLMGNSISFSDILLQSDALINIPVLKTHGISGLSFALKNHYGTFDKPGHFHGTRILQALGELNTLAPIRDRTRLIIGDALTICTRGWYEAVTGDSIFMSFDPVAHDAAGLKHFAEVKTAEGSNPAQAQDLGAQWLAHAAQLGLGQDKLDETDIVEVHLS